MLKLKDISKGRHNNTLTSFTRTTLFGGLILVKEFVGDFQLDPPISLKSSV
jgi:hypothetical protein